MDKKKIIQYVFRILIFVVISLVVGLTIYNINAQRLTGKKLIMPFNKTIGYILTGSMEPTIGINDLIVIEKTNDYQIDDIVVYQDGRSLVVHRIISIDGDIITTAGDANDGEDDPINASLIEGEVIRIIPFLGLLLKLIKSPIGVTVIIATGIFLLVISYKKENQETNESLEEIKQEIEKLKKELNKTED